jgi:membrane-associated phospholipid phosphatase
MIVPPPDGTGIPDVPDVAGRWYRLIAGAGAAAPHWLQWLVDAGAELAPVLMAAALVLLWWRARGAGAGAMAGALAAGGLTVAAYGLSELVKAGWQVERPCRTLGDVVTVAACPAPGDWSFPSNHATFAAAAAVGIAFLRPAAAWLVVPVAVLVGVARVAVGVHYPTDVLAGLLLGGAVAALQPAVARPLAAAVARLRPRGVLLLGPGPADDARTVRLRRPRH